MGEMRCTFFLIRHRRTEQNFAGYAMDFSLHDPLIALLDAASPPERLGVRLRRVPQIVDGPHFAAPVPRSDASSPAKALGAVLAGFQGPGVSDTAERRQVTVMFSDLVGSTALSARMDPEDLREVISAYQKCVADTVRRFGGFVAKYMGDGVLIYFGYPEAHEDDADRAVRAGLEVITGVTALKSPVPVQTRVGIATGMVVVGDLIGSGEAQERGISGGSPVNLVVRADFNPNLRTAWSSAMTQVINQITLLTVILTGAALIREREQGTVEHLLVMPVVPAEIMLAKMLANGLVILVAAMLSLQFVVHWWIGAPIAGSLLLFLLGAALYALVVAALGILLGTLATTLGQFGLLAMPVLIVAQLLLGSSTPMESMPVWLQYVMRTISPTPHFVSFAQAVLFRGADLTLVWRPLVAMLIIGSVYFAFAMSRFRRVIFGS